MKVINEENNEVDSEAGNEDSEVNRDGSERMMQPAKQSVSEVVRETVKKSSWLG